MFRVIATLVPGNDGYNLQAVTWNDSIAKNKSLTLRGGEYAETNAAVDTNHQIGREVKRVASRLPAFLVLRRRP
jgi:hypothetical protein